MKISYYAYAAVLAAWLGSRMEAQVLFYNFNNLSGGTTSASESLLNQTPTLSLSGADLVAAGQAGVAFTDESGTAHAAGLAAAWSSGIDAPGGNSFRMHLDTTGYENFVVRYDYRSTSSGSPSAALSYRLGDSGAFTPITSQSFTRDGTFHSTSVDLSALSSIENVSNVSLLWELAPGSGSGTFRVDNLQLSGAAVVPEPREYALVAGGALLLFGVCGRRRRAEAVPTA